MYDQLKLNILTYHNQYHIQIKLFGTRDSVSIKVGN